MVCAYCKIDDVGPYILIPSNIPGEIFSCISCAKKKKIYCERHDVPHQGFIDKTHACDRCINEKVLESSEEQNRALFRTIENLLDGDELWELLEAADDASEIMGCSLETSVVRFIWSKALRENKTPEEIMQRIARERSAKCIL